MSALLHLPQGGAQITVVSEIPELPIPGEDTSIEDVLATLGQYTYVVTTDGTYKTPQQLWDEYEDWEKNPINGDMVIVNATKHNGLNFQPTSGVHPYEVSFMFIDRVMNFASKRLIGTVQLSEGGWGNTMVNIHLIPYDVNRSVATDIAKVRDYLNGNPDDEIVTMSYRHNGYGDANDDLGLMVTELAAAGKYKVAISMEPSSENVCPSVYSLKFRTY